MARGTHGVIIRARRATSSNVEHRRAPSSTVEQRRTRWTSSNVEQRRAPSSNVEPQVFSALVVITTIVWLSSFSGGFVKFCAPDDECARIVWADGGGGFKKNIPKQYIRKVATPRLGTRQSDARKLANRRRAMDNG
jgi:hypothetical protein